MEILKIMVRKFPVPSIPEQKISRTFPYRHSRTIFSRGNTNF